MKRRMIKIDPKKLKLLDLNARFMRHEEFQKLVANIKQDEGLTSVPFACLDSDGNYLVLSGNHRVKAAISAGLEEIDVMVTDDQLSPDRRKGIQLSHNAIVGEDDPFILKQIYEGIQDIEWKAYSGLDDKTLELLEKVNAQSLSEANLSFQTLSITFLPDELEAARKVIDEAIESTKNADESWLTIMSHYDKWLDAQDKVAAVHGVKNVATAFDLILKVFERNICQLSEVWEEDTKDDTWVPIDTVIGRTTIPVSSAKIIKKAIDRMVSRGDITSKNLWQAIEYLAADYLAG